jgi:hypothetical protein
MAPLRKEETNEVFPAADIDFISKVRWAFSRRSRISMLRSTLESCKLTLSVMLNTMQLAERVSRRRQLSVSTVQEDEYDKAMTQSLLISQHYAVEELGHWENEVEKEEELARVLPPSDARTKMAPKKSRRRSRGRLVEMFSGLRVETQLPLSNTQNQQPVVHRERPSVWLESILAPPPEPGDVHPGRLVQKRLSSVGTANAPMELLQKWTDQGPHLHRREQHPSPERKTDIESDLWRDSKFSFQEPPRSSVATDSSLCATKPDLVRKTSDFVSPKTGRVHSIGFHVIAGVDGALEASHLTTARTTDDCYEAITEAILEDHAAALDVNEVALCISYGGKAKILSRKEKPLDVLKHYTELELEPRLFVRRVHGKPP